MTYLPACTNPILMAEPFYLESAIKRVIKANADNFDTQGLSDEMEQQLSRKVNPKAYNIYPQGRRIIGVLDPIPERVGHIALPEEYRAREKMGAGIVMSVGPEVGQPAPFPGAPMLKDPQDLLYEHVVFGMHAGNVLRLDMMDNAYHSGIIVMTDRDIWAIDKPNVYLEQNPHGRVELES